MLEGGCACGEVRSSSGGTGTGTGTGPGSPRSKVEWVTIPDGVPAFDDYYDMKKLWPPESLKRVGRVLGQPVE